MSYKKFVIPLSPYPKPRGEIGKAGNMTHSSGGYRGWQNTFLKQLRSVAGQPHTYQKIQALVILQSRTKKRGLPDVTNLAGAVEDTLIEAKWLKDDNFKINPRVYSECFERSFDAIEIYIFPQYQGWKQDLLKVLSDAILTDNETATIKVTKNKK